MQLNQQAGARAFRSVDLASVGRDLVLSGESVWILEPAGWLQCLPRPEVRLADDRRDWLYRLELSGGGSRMASGSRVGHFQWAADPNSPAVGLGPLQTPAARFAARLEQALEGESKSAHGYVLGLPASAGGDFDKLKSDSQGLEGKNLDDRKFLRNFQPIHSGIPDRKLGLFQPIRFGFDPPETLQKFLELSVALALEACGLPAQLVMGRQEGMAARESLRRLRVVTLQPLMVMITNELAKAGAPHSFKFSGDLSNDLSTRARSFNALVRGGMSIDAAVAATGLRLAFGWRLRGRPPLATKRSTALPG